MRNGNRLKSRVSEIHVKQIHVNQGLGIPTILVNKQFFGNFTFKMASIQLEKFEWQLDFGLELIKLINSMNFKKFPT